MKSSNFNHLLKFFIYLSLLINSEISCSFQISLFNKINSKYKENNLIISPLSIFQAISLVTNGANGETQKELLKLLDNKEMEEINMINSKILKKLKENSSLEIANAIMSKLSPLNDFTYIAKNTYDSEILPLKNVNQVNKWCDKKTHGKISKIIDQLDPMTFMLVLNAVYFKGEWTNQFQEHLTRKQVFYNFNKEEINIDTMENTKYFNYFEDTNLQAIELNFKKESISALIILPSKKLNINEFIEILDKDNEYYYSIINNLKNTKVNLRLPKFELTYSKKLKEVLKTIGVNLPFERNADFSKIRNQNDIYINEIIHKTYLKVNEQGTEAAAVTAVEMLLASAFQPEPEKIYFMHVNRPFLFILRNKNLPKNYDIVFISKIEELN